MSAEIIITWDPDKLFPITKRVYNFVCRNIGKSARKKKLQKITEMCDAGLSDGRLLVIDLDNQNKMIFASLLLESLNNGSITKEILSWDTPAICTKSLLNENKTDDVIKFTFAYSCLLYTSPSPRDA